MTERSGGHSPPKPKLRHHLPTSLRQHWKLLAGLVAFLIVLVGVFGSTMMRPYITSDTTIVQSSITENISGTVDLFDTSVEHTVSVDITDEEYNEMITEYENNGDKVWVTADVTIDGTTISDVAVRLKGNSTLMGLRGDNGGGPPGRTDEQAGEAPADATGDADGDAAAAPAEATDSAAPADGTADAATGAEGTADAATGEGATEGPGEGGMGGGMGGMMSSVSADDPTSLPLLLDFSRNTDGRAYQGLTQLSVRPGSPVLNEAMALSITAATDQPTQRYAYTVYSVNDSATTTRLLLEVPDETYANSLFDDSEGYLYKADASSSFTYVGDDQADYTDQFDQLNGDGAGDLQPIISFLKWLDSADDETFDRELADWVDVDSFAEYVATQNLLVNSDDMSGPGQNYYLWYDRDTGKLSVISWDLNLAMNGSTDAGPDDSVSMGGGMPGGGGPGGETADGQLPEGIPQEVADAIANGQMPEGLPGGDQGGSGGSGPGGNALKERFLASDAFADLYTETYWDLYDRIYGNGTAQTLLDGLADSVPTSDGLTAEELATDIDSMRTWITARTDALADIRSTT